MAKQIRVYEYSKCSTCVKALKFLETHQISFEKRAIVETPPSVAELKKALVSLKKNGQGLKHLFNTSGVQYRELGIAGKLEQMSEAEALKLLSEHGKLVKRPLLISDEICLVGFKPESWEVLLS